MIKLNQPILVNRFVTQFYIRNACNKSGSPPLVTDIKKQDDSKLKDSYVLCLNHIKRYDRENYLAALCIKDPLFRRAVVALRAFNVELSLVRDSTTNSDRAKLRLNFWAKLIEEIIRRDDELDLNSNKLTAYYNYTPVAKELLELFHLMVLDDEMKNSLHDLIGSRLSSKVLGYKLFDNLSDLELYCSKSNTPIYHLGWNMGLQLHNTFQTNYNILSSISAVTNLLGKAHGLSNVIRGIPYNASKGCCYIPKDLLAEHNLTSRDFVGKVLDQEKIKPVVEKLSTRCQNLINEAYSDIPGMPRYFKQLFLPRVSIQVSLNKLKKCNYNICDARLIQKDNTLPLNLWMASKYFRAPII